MFLLVVHPGAWGRDGQKMPGIRAISWLDTQMAAVSHIARVRIRQRPELVGVYK